MKLGEIREYSVEPERFETARHPIDALRAEDPERSLALVKAALAGKNRPASDLVALNAGAAVYVSGQAGTLEQGVEMARDAIGAGLATEKLAEFVRFTRQVKASAEA